MHTQGDFMAISNQVAVGTYAAVVSAGTAVTPNIAPYDNTHTIMVYNPDTTNTIYVAFLTTGTSIPIGDAIFVPPNASITLAIGARSSRPPLGTFSVDASAGTPTARITYINGLQS